MSEYDSRNDVELTNEYTRNLSKSGASDLMIDLIQYPKERAGVGRHSALEEVKRYIYNGELDEPRPDFRPRGGHFFTAMWEGRLFDAWVRADFNNKALLLDCFGRDAIIAAATRAGNGPDYANRMVQEVRS